MHVSMHFYVHIHEFLSVFSCIFLFFQNYVFYDLIIVGERCVAVHLCTFRGVSVHCAAILGKHVA